MAEWKETIPAQRSKSPSLLYWVGELFCAHGPALFVALFSMGSLISWILLERWTYSWYQFCFFRVTIEESLGNWCTGSEMDKPDSVFPPNPQFKKGVQKFKCKRVWIVIQSPLLLCGLWLMRLCFQDKYFWMQSFLPCFFKKKIHQLGVPQQLEKINILL